MTIRLLFYDNPCPSGLDGDRANGVPAIALHRANGKKHRQMMAEEIPNQPSRNGM
jgi:hypothetical protein